MVARLAGQIDEVESAAPPGNRPRSLLQDLPEEAVIHLERSRMLRREEEPERPPEYPQRQKLRPESSRRFFLTQLFRRPLVSLRQKVTQDPVDFLLASPQVLPVSRFQVGCQRPALPLHVQIQHQVIPFEVEPKDPGGPELRKV